MTAKEGSTKKLGLTMVIIAWVMALALITWGFAGLVERARNPNRDVSTAVSSSGVREVVLTRNRYGHYVARGRVNGQPVTFLVDTGATFVSVPESLAQRLGLERGSRLTTQTANGVAVAYATVLPSVSIGEIELRNVRATINPGMDSDDDVLLGMSFLKHLVLTQSDGQLTLSQRQ